MIVVEITMNIMPEKQLEIIQTLLSLIGPAEKETGCLKYSACCNITDQNRFIILQEWETREDFEHHIASHRFGVLLSTKALLSEPLKIRIYTVARSEGMETVHAVRNKPV